MSTDLGVRRLMPSDQAGEENWKEMFNVEIMKECQVGLKLILRVSVKSEV